MLSAKSIASYFLFMKYFYLTFLSGIFVYLPVANAQNAIDETRVLLGPQIHWPLILFTGVQ